MTHSLLESPVEKPVQIFLAISGATLLFALMNLFVKLAAETHSIPQIMFFRNFIGMLPVIWLILSRKELHLFRTRHLSGHFVRGFVGFFSMCCIFGLIRCCRLPTPRRFCLPPRLS